MALVPITHVYDTLSVINNTGLLDGQILYTTDQTVNKIFADVKVNNILRRIEIGGTNEIDTVLNQESGHAIANSAVAKLAQTVHTNLLNPTLGTTTINGVTCTKNSDGTYTLTGTATELVTLDICTVDVVEGVSYRLVGCPSGGSSTTYRMGLYTNESSPTSIIQDLGTGHNWASDRTATIKVRIVIQPNYAISGSLVFKPMLTTDSSVTYDDYVQYSGNGELNQNVASLYNNLNTTNSNLTALDTKVGAQSLLPTPSQSVTQNINTLKAEINQINSNLTDKLEPKYMDDITSWTQLFNRVYARSGGGVVSGYCNSTISTDQGKLSYYGYIYPGGLYGSLMIISFNALVIVSVINGSATATRITG